jgi:methylenetetrahydrofolate--tRNA-(uracil-5-)-methyltransferase
MQRVLVAGGGLAGPEAAWQLARSGIPVLLYEMRPERSTAAHRTGAMAELVCSNSLKTDQEPSAPWLLKQELRLLDSLLMRVAANTRVPGGHALTVDRDAFAEAVTAAISAVRDR